MKYHATESTKDCTHSSTAVYLSSMRGPGFASQYYNKTNHTGLITQKEQRALNIKYDLKKKSQRLSSLTFAEKLKKKSRVKKMVRTWNLKQTKN